MNDEEKFQKLCQAQIDGTATDDERARLAEIMRGSPEARRAYIQQMRIHAMLTWQHGRSQATLSEVIPPRNVTPFPRWQRWTAAAAAVLMLLGVGAWWNTRRNEVMIEVLAANQVAFQPGERVSRRSFEFGQGSLRFRMASGAVVDASGPVRFELVNSMHLRVQSGSVTADIGEGAKGFIIETPDARIVDLGTRFGVRAGGGNGTDVAVFEGKVDVYDRPGKPSPQQAKITLTEGEAVRLQASARSKRLPMVRLGADARSIEGASASDLVADVTDNVEERENLRYYGLVRRGMGEGARVYTTGRHRTWHPMPGQSFPAELLGGDAICTFDTDRKDPNLKVWLQIARPCDLYVMADSKEPVPAWLRDGFVNTGLMIRSGPWIPRGTPPEAEGAYYANDAVYVACSVWKKRVVAPGIVELGTPYTPESKGRAKMYSLAVKEVR